MEDILMFLKIMMFLFLLIFFIFLFINVVSYFKSLKKILSNIVGKLDMIAKKQKDSWVFYLKNSSINV